MFFSVENGRFFFPNTWQMMIFPNPLDALIPKNSIFIFCRILLFWACVTSGAQGSVSVGFWGARELSLFWGGV